MKDFALLFGVLLKQTFRRDKSKPQAKAKWYVFLVAGLIAVCCLPLLGLIAYIIYQIGQMAAQLNATTSILTCILSAIQVVVLLFGIASVVNTVYYSRDNEMLLAYPLKPQVIFAAKLTYAYLIELMTAFLFTLFAVIPFAIGAGLNFSIGLVLSFFLLPILPLMVATIIAIPLIYVISYFKHNSIIATIALLIVTIILFVAYFFAVNSLGMMEDTADMQQMLQNMVATFDAIANVMIPNKFLALSMTETAFTTAALNFVYAMLIDLALLAVAVFISSFVYRRSISKQLETPKSQSKKQTKYETGGKISMLIKKDFLEIIRFPTLAFYCLFEIILAPILIFVLGVTSMGSLDTTIEEVGMSFVEIMALVPDLVAIVLICFAIFMVFATNYMASTAFTRENKNFYMIKILPVSYADIIDAKAILSVIVNEIGVILMLVVSTFVLKVPLLSVAIAFVISSVINVVFSYMQVYIDLKKPRLNWENISTGLKNNPSSLISLLVSVILIGVLGGLYYLVSLAQIPVLVYIYFAVLLLLFVALAFVARKITIKDAQIYIDNIIC